MIKLLLLPAAIIGLVFAGIWGRMLYRYLDLKLQALRSKNIRDMLD